MNNIEMIKNLAERNKVINSADVLYLIAQLEAAQLELIKPLPIGELVHRLEGQTYEKWYDDDELDKMRERAEAAEAKLLVPEGYCIMPESLTAENGAKVALSGEFPGPSGMVSNSCFAAVCTEKPNGNYSIKCWRIPTKLAEAA
ncbi:hypothetical protein PGS49_19680 [Yersinia intermedia]|uniref:hypothetical protein n=1 Tax=Yersinia intermedia TaxID=631 RepID=UPI0022FDB776|nr:hypothetical protein [Yersinia intermedia]MDA5482848.1 hypothetical protein [Yersinia intermedia]